MKVSKKELQWMSEELDKNYNDIAEDLEERWFEVERGVGLLWDAVSFLSDLQKAVKTIYALKEQWVSQTQLKKELEVFKTYVENKVKPVTEKSSMIDETIKDMEESVTSMITTSRELIEDTMDEKLWKTKELHEALAEIVKSIERDLMQQEKEIWKKADKEELKIKLEKKDLQDIETRLSQKIIDDEEISKETTFSSDEIVKRIEDIKKNMKVWRWGGSTARIFIQDEWTDLWVANILDFKGAWVTVTEQGWKHIVTVPWWSSVWSFLDLTDVPSAYTGQGWKVVAVKADVSGLEFIAATSTDEKVKYDAGDPTAWYVADKIIAGTGISVAEGIWANENKLVITNEGWDVSKVWTPADNQVGVWTWDGTIEWTAKFTRDDSTKTMTLGDWTTEAYIYGKDKWTWTWDWWWLLFGWWAWGTTWWDWGNITFNWGNATAWNGNWWDIVFVWGYPQGAWKYWNVYLAEWWEDNYLQITPTLYVIENWYNKLYKFKWNGFYGIIDMASVATADKTFTFPNATWTVALTSDIIWIIRTVESKASDFTAWSTASVDYVYFVTWTTTCTMPTAVWNTNRYTIKCVSWVLTIDWDWAETIDWAANIWVAVEDSVDLVSNGTEWKVI